MSAVTVQLRTVTTNVGRPLTPGGSVPERPSTIGVAHFDGTLMVTIVAEDGAALAAALPDGVLDSFCGLLADAIAEVNAQAAVAARDAGAAGPRTVN